MSETDPARPPDTLLPSQAEKLAPALIAEAQVEAIERVRAELVTRISAALMRDCESRLFAAPNEAPAEGTPPARKSEATAPARESEVTAPAREPVRAPETLIEPVRQGELALYVYGVVASSATLPEDLAGVDPDGAARLIGDDRLAAIASPVPMSEFGEERIRENLNDVAWLEDTARAHERVLEATLEETAVVPLRLCTVFAGEEQVQEMLSRERSLLLDALDRLAGKAEWGVKAFADPAALEAEAVSKSGEPREQGNSPGTAYMNRRRRDARAKEAAEEVADEWAHRIHVRLAEAAADALLNPLQRQELSGHEGEMLLNGVYLVPDEDVGRFRDCVAALRDEFDPKGVDVVLTGPWPAYNFVKSSIEAAR